MKEALKKLLTDYQNKELEALEERSKYVKYDYMWEYFSGKAEAYSEAYLDIKKILGEHL